MPRRPFHGRERELAALMRQLEDVRRDGEGRIVAVRGRRQIGKSRLVEEFLARADVPAVFFTAARQSPADELRAFAAELAAAEVEGATIAAAGHPGSWEAALVLATTGATPERPIVVVLDELPYLVEGEPAFEATLQRAWDRVLERRPVLLVLVGSDLAMMEALDGYGRPLYGRVHELVVRPLSPAAVAAMAGLGAAEALDAYLVVGGYPRLVETWRRGETLRAYLRRALDDPEAPLLVLGERSVNAELPPETKARTVLEAIGSGERGFAALQARAGVAGRTLDTALSQLAAKRIVSRSQPFSAEERPRLTRYVVADPYLRFWLRFLARAQPLVERGRGDVALAQIEAAWPAYAGRAIEPVVREAIERLLPDPRLGAATSVGGYWNRDGSIEVDLVGGRGERATPRVHFVGSVKWRQRAPFDRADVARLAEDRGRVPGADAETRLVGVSRAGFAAPGLDLELAPADLLAAHASAR